LRSAAVLIGRITGLARPPVRPSVSVSLVRAPNSNTEKRRKTEIGVNVSGQE